MSVFKSDVSEVEPVQFDRGKLRTLRSLNGPSSLEKPLQRGRHDRLGASLQALNLFIIATSTTTTQHNKHRQPSN